MSKSKNINNSSSEFALNDETSPHGGDNQLSTSIAQQAKKTFTSNKNLLYEVCPGVFLFTITKTQRDSSLRLKKLSDRIQYAILPDDHDNDPFMKLSFAQVKNLCHQNPPSALSLKKAQGKHFSEHAHVFFYYHFNYIESILIKKLSDVNLCIKEKLSNNILIITDGKFNYPFNLAIIASRAIFGEGDIIAGVSEATQSISKRFAMFEELLSGLTTEFPAASFSLKEGYLKVSHEGLSKPFDYGALCDDIIYSGYDNKISSFLNRFSLGDLDLTNSYPSICVRSPLHLKARPNSMSASETGHALCAVFDAQGTQTPTLIHQRHQKDSFSLWKTRSERHIPRHVYNARVIKYKSQKDFVVSLIGEQAASIALFPALVKGVLEHVNCHNVNEVNLIAHNEDVLTIAPKTASWRATNEISQKADTLFKMVCADGADPLTFFECTKLPDSGVGTFNLQEVPHQFFELVDTASSMKKTLPPGHDHYLLGLAFECLHEWGLAASEYQKALRLDSNDPEILHALGSAYMELGRVKEGYPFLKKAFAKMPEDPEIANNMGLSSLECGNIADAVSAFERAVKLSPGTADYLTNLGQSYLASSRNYEALEILNKAVRCNPNFAQAHHTLANLYLSEGKRELARKHALLAYKENPVDKSIANLLWRLRVGEKENAKS